MKERTEYKVYQDEHSVTSPKKKDLFELELKLLLMCVTGYTFANGNIEVE